MINYTNFEIYSFGILLFFFGQFIQTVKSYFFVEKKKAIKQKKKVRSLLSKHKTIKSLKSLSWYDFELLTMELYAKMGWEVRGNEKKGADGGVDVWMRKGRKTAIVQCKRYENSPVTIKLIREMYGLKYEYDADEVYIVTTSRFTKDCASFAKGKNILLVDGNDLVQLIAEYQ
jgi:restriction system protein